MNRVFLLLSLAAACLLFGTRVLEAADDPRAAQLTYKPWIKMCLGNSSCFIATGARGACNPSGGGLLVIATDEKSVSLSVHFGTRRMLESAISVQIDQDDPILIPHPECNGMICRGQIQIEGDFIQRLKRSQTITIGATDAAHQKSSLALSLAGFAEAYDGPAAPLPKVVEETQEKLQEELKRREEELKTLQCQE
jgi:invasion protein IalB